MTDDLVKRLHDWENVYPEDEDKQEGHLYHEAADRIEELEAKLAKAVGFIEDLTGCEWPYNEDAKRTLAELSSVSCANLKGETE